MPSLWTSSEFEQSIKHKRWHYKNIRGHCCGKNLVFDDGFPEYIVRSNWFGIVRFSTWLLLCVICLWWYSLGSINSTTTRICIKSTQFARTIKNSHSNINYIFPPASICIAFQFPEELVCPAHSVVTRLRLGSGTGGAIKWKSEQSLSQLAADHLRRVHTLESTWTSSEWSQFCLVSSVSHNPNYLSEKEALGPPPHLHLLRLRTEMETPSRAQIKELLALVTALLMVASLV